MVGKRQGYSVRSKYVARWKKFERFVVRRAVPGKVLVFVIRHETPVKALGFVLRREVPETFWHKETN